MSKNLLTAVSYGRLIGFGEYTFFSSGVCAWEVAVDRILWARPRPRPAKGRRLVVHPRSGARAAAARVPAALPMERRQAYNHLHSSLDSDAFSRQILRHA